MDQLEQLCRDHGLKLTIQRRIVLEVLEASADHPSAYEVQQRTEKQRRIALATVYRSLNALTDAGLVTRHIFADGKTRYERAGRDAHPHLIAVDSGEIVEVDEVNLRQLLKKEATRLGYRLVDYRLKLYGARKQ